MLERSSTEPALLLYTSDHGLTVPPCGDTYRHGPSLSSLEVPFLAWGNAALRTQHPTLMPPLQAQQPPEHSTALLAEAAIRAVGYGTAMAATAPWNAPRPLQFQQRTLTELRHSNACTLE
ncbi:hypothetical protein [Comamonas sp. GB3 AK4-5]|uniref:hypothetical protein n=1 Tax=Comamonas sp. GB3 AK4-5 TaxID=3231487 RepID=UPI00351E830E